MMAGYLINAVLTMAERVRLNDRSTSQQRYYDLFPVNLQSAWLILVYFPPTTVLQSGWPGAE